MPGLVQLKSIATRKISQYAKQQKAFQARNARSLVAIEISATLAQRPRSAVLCCWLSHWYSWHSKKHESMQTFPISLAAFSLGRCHGTAGCAENFNFVT